ncbi:MAG: signal peptidase I [Oscillospiraceae bacterium]|nr:signal peptidase I [Oscillospiraceae bacterium]
MKKMKLKGALRFLLLILCGLVLGVNVYLLNANSLVGNQLPMPFGYGAAVVLSGSMEPTFSAGDLIVVKQTDSFARKDIVVFQDGNSLVVHRIVQLDEETITTKGDANQVADEPISVSAVKGKVQFWIPHAGTVVKFLKTPLGTILIIALAIALIEIPHLNEKKKDDEDRQKLLDEIKRLKDEVEAEMKDENPSEKKTEEIEKIDEIEEKTEELTDKREEE